MLYIRRAVLLEKKHGLEMGRETHSNIKYLRGRSVLGDYLVKSRFLVVISGIKVARGVSHHLT